MDPKTLETLSIGLYIAGGVFLFAAVFFFWKLKIPAVVSDLSGKTARRAIDSRREGVKKSKLAGISQAKQVNTSGSLAGQTLPLEAQPGSDATMALGGQATSPLGADATTPLGNAGATTPLSQYVASGPFDTGTDSTLTASTVQATEDWTQQSMQTTEDWTQRPRSAAGPDWNTSSNVDYLTSETLDPENKNMNTATLGTTRLVDDEHTDQLEDRTVPLNTPQGWNSEKIKIYMREILVHTQEEIPVHSY